MIDYDVGYVATSKIIDNIKAEMNYQRVKDPQLIKQIIIDKMFLYYIQDTEVNVDINFESKPNKRCFSSLRVNGVGKQHQLLRLLKVC